MVQLALGRVEALLLIANKTLNKRKVVAMILNILFTYKLFHFYHYRKTIDTTITATHAKTVPFEGGRDFVVLFSCEIVYFFPGAIWMGCFVYWPPVVYSCFVEKICVFADFVLGLIWCRIPSRGEGLQGLLVSKEPHLPTALRMCSICFQKSQEAYHVR